MGFFQNRAQGLLTMLRITAQASAAFFITAAMLHYGAGLTAVGSYLEQLQIVPAALAVSLATLMFWFAVTLIFGRIYCSTVCPLSAMLDLFARLRGPARIYRYAPPASRLRMAALIILALFFASALLPRQWLEPYGLYASMVSAVARPRLTLATLFGIAILAALAYSAWSRGRIFCSTICPVGTLLGCVSRSSALHIDIDTDRCIQCRRCADVCKAQCIDLQSHTTDMSRCVVCFNCLPVCPNDAITYTIRRHTLSIPMMQHTGTAPSASPIQSPTTPSTPCNNTSNCSTTSSPTE